MHINLQKNKWFCLAAFLIFATNSLYAQRVCGTMQAIQNRMLIDSNYRKDFEKKEADLATYLSQHPYTESFATGDSIIIPVVVHIVLSNPNLVTDDNVDYFINRMNEDFSGRNADSASGSPFYGVRGHSLIRFALARRTPSGNPTTGIERRTSSATITGNNPEPVKAAATGLAPWDIAKYYNLWVGDVGTTGLLGVSPEIGPGTQAGPAIDGVCCSYLSFSSNACYSDPLYALARTSVHEIGHNMGLNHTFQGGCTSSDFTDNLSSVGMALPASLLTAADDTPPTRNPTYGTSAGGVCSIGASVTNGCTPAVPKMYQNFMDYTDDPCMNMFTKGQVKRMQYVIETFRPGYLTTKGHLPPDGTPINEAGANSIVSPGGSEIIGCTAINYPNPTCGSGTFIPKLKVTNYGVNKLTSITVNLDMNGVVVATQTFATNLLANKSAVFTLPSQTLATGANVLKFYTSNPNGIIDSLPTNDTITKSIFYNNLPAGPTTLPLFEGFEDGGFNPTATGWKVNNATTGTNTFTRTTAAFKTGAAATTIKLFGNTATGDFDYLYSPQLNFNNTTDSVYVSFNYAYRIKGTTAASRRDTLSVEVTKNCDPTAATWTSLWKKGGTALPTNATAIASNFIATAADWTTTPVKISLWNYKNAPIYLTFKTRNGNGQNIFIDDINVYAVSPLPLTLTQFTAQQNSNNIVCKWETKQELDVANFEVERSIDGKQFNKIGTVSAQGNTSAITAAFYKFTDESYSNLKSNSLYYRLKMNDKNGKFSYSNVVFVKIGSKQTLQIFPNPVADFVNLQISNTSAIATKTTVKIVDYLGRVVLSKNIVVATGNQTIEFATSNLTKGNYVMIVATDNEINTLKFLKD
jgi:Pregnancy-associated plasma protein-A/Secretion system C-terminal sorting domain